MTDPLDAPNFLDAVKRTNYDLKVSRGSVHIKTFSFLQSVRANISETKFSDLDSPVDRCNLLLSYLQEALSKEEISLLTVDDMIAVVSALVNANPVPKPLAWQRDSANRKEADKYSTDYEWREIAFIVATLASVFGWTAEYILHELTYYEVSCYLQEAMLIEHDRNEFLYSISQTGFRKSGDDYEKIPYPSIPWRRLIEKAGKPIRVPLPAKYRPDGVVIEFTKDGVVRHEIPVAESGAREADDVGTAIDDNSVVSSTS